MTLSNSNAAAITLTAAFTDTLPAGVRVAPTPNPTTTCPGGAVNAVIGGSAVTLSAGSTIPSGSCSIEVNVTPLSAGAFLNTIPAGTLQTSAGNNAVPASATLTGVAVIPLPLPPVPPVPTVPCTLAQPDIFVVKSHSAQFVVGTNATYTIALVNHGVASSGTITVADTLPAGLTFVSASGAGWTCAANGQIVTCTTTASAPLGAYPNDITLTVTPGAGAVPGVTNIAAVAGGGDCDVTNNASADITVVATQVPTLSEWAFIMLAVLLAAAGVVALRRRRRA